MLQYDAYGIGILFQVYGGAVWLAFSSVGELHVFHAVEEVQPVVDHAVGIAVQIAVEVLESRNSGLSSGNIEMVGVFTSPYEYVVAAGIDLQANFVVACELTVSSVDASSEFACLGVECQKCHVFHFRIECIGFFQVVVVRKFDEVITGIAIAVFKNRVATACQNNRCH